METFGIIGMSFGITAWALIASLRKDFEELKKDLQEAGVLKELAEPEGT